MKAGEGRGVGGFQTTTLGWGEVVGEAEGGEVVERVPDLLEAAFVLEAARRDRAQGRLGAQLAERIAQQRAAVRLVRAAEELDEPRGFGRGHAVPLGAVEELVLVLVAKLAQVARERRADGALGELLLRGG